MQDKDFGILEPAVNDNTFEHANLLRADSKQRLRRLAPTQSQRDLTADALDLRHAVLLDDPPDFPRPP